MVLKSNHQRITELKNKHDGERIFIIGTGPSILNMDLNPLKNEILFGVNKLYTGYEKINIRCQYYAASDPKIPYRQELLDLDTKLFLGHGAYDQFVRHYLTKIKLIEKKPLLIPLLGWMWENENNFSKDLTRGTFNGWTIIVDIPLQACFYMGFSKVYLLGCDWNFSGESAHFYDSKKLSCDPQFHDRSRKSYAICKKKYEDAGKEIINLTPNSKLDIFKHQKLSDLC